MAAETTTTTEEERQYVLVSAVHGPKSKKLHWVIAEKKKTEAWFLKGRPAESLCGIRASRVCESSNELPLDKIEITPENTTKIIPFTDFFFALTEEEHIKELKMEWDYGYIRKRKRTIREPGTKVIEVAGQQFTVPNTRVEEITFDDIKAEAWCKICQRKKKE